MSLTSYGARVDTVFLTIETIARGRVLPSRLILWLDRPDAFETLPYALRRLEARGLEILFTSNFGPHKKYYPYVASQGEFDVPLVTADDDVLYPRYWLAGLVDAAATAPTVIHCYRARKIRIAKNGLDSYSEWPMCTDSETSFLTFPTGVSGVLYPPAFLGHLKSRGDVFMQICETADDMWLHATAVRENFPARQVLSRSIHFPVIPGTQEQSLMINNLLNERNDKIISLTYSNIERSRLVAESKLLTAGEQC